MKLLDKFFRFYRFKVVLKLMKKKSYNSLLDIGCHDLYALKNFDKNNIARNLYGLDCRLPISKYKNFSLFELSFPVKKKENLLILKNIRFDCIISMATFEHVKEKELTNAVNQLSELLDDNGEIFLTVPSPAVDYILNVLSILSLIDSKELDLDAHNHLSITKLKSILSKKFTVRHHFFQMGLNNLLWLKKKKN